MSVFLWALALVGLASAGIGIVTGLAIAGRRIGETKSSSVCQDTAHEGGDNE